MIHLNPNKTKSAAIKTASSIVWHLLNSECNHKYCKKHGTLTCKDFFFVCESEPWKGSSFCITVSSARQTLRKGACGYKAHNPGEQSSWEKPEVCSGVLFVIPTRFGSAGVGGRLTSCFSHRKSRMNKYKVNIMLKIVPKHSYHIVTDSRFQNKLRGSTGCTCLMELVQGICDKMHK